MIVSTTNDIAGHRIVRHLGVVRGIIVRSRSVIGNIGAGIHCWWGNDKHIAWGKAGGNLIMHASDVAAFSKSLKGKPSYDSKADIFSLGVLLFEMFMLKVRHFIQECKNITCLSFVQSN